MLQSIITLQLIKVHYKS